MAQTFCLFVENRKRQRPVHGSDGTTTHRQDIPRMEAYEDEEATLFEVKRKADNIDMKVLENKAAAFLRATGEFKGYKISYKGLSMDDM